MKDSTNELGLSAADNLAVRCAIASLEFLKDAADGSGIGIAELTAESLATWLKSR